MNRQLATPGAVVMLGGMFLVWWALSSKHGDVQESWLDKMQRSSSAGKRFYTPPSSLGKQPATQPIDNHSRGAGGQLKR